MSTSYLQKKYNAQHADGHRSVHSLTQPHGIQGTIDPRFDALIQRATVSARSNQISPEVNIESSSSNTNSTTTLDSKLQE